MNELRIILILIGLMIVVGLFVMTFRQLQKKRSAAPADAHTSTVENQSRLSLADINKDGPKLYQENIKTLTSHFLDKDILSEFGDDVDWDNIDELDLEWLEDSIDTVNYDELMYQLEQGHGDPSIGDYMMGYGYPQPSEKVFVSIKNPDDEKTRRAINSTQNLDTLVLVIHIFARNGKKFHGEDLLNATKKLGMHHGEMDLFHAYAHPDFAGEVQHKQRIFSLVNIIEPGSFNIGKIKSLQTPGISLLLQLPSPVDSAVAFEQYYKTAKSLALNLDGVLYDSSKNKMTKQSLNHMKDQVAEYHLKMQFPHQVSIH